MSQFSSVIFSTVRKVVAGLCRETQGKAKGVKWLSKVGDNT